MSAVPDRIFVTSEKRGSIEHPFVENKLEAYQNDKFLRPNWKTYIYTMQATDALIKKESDALTKEMRERDAALKQRVDGVESNQASLTRRIEEVYQQHSEKLEKADQDIRHAKTEIIQKINTVLVDEIRRETQQEVQELRAALQMAKQEAEELRQELNKVKNVASRTEEQANKLSEEMQKIRDSISSLRR